MCKNVYILIYQICTVSYLNNTQWKNEHLNHYTVSEEVRM